MDSIKYKKVLVVGAGLSGLSAAYKLSQNGAQVTVVEKNKYLGGISSTFSHKGFLLDYGPHKLYTIIPAIDKFIRKLVGKDLQKKPKKCLVLLKGKLFNYPVKITQLLLGVNPFLSFKIGLDFVAAYLNRSRKKKEDSYEDYLINNFGREAYSLVFRDYAKKVWGEPKKISSDLAKSRVSVPNLATMLKVAVLKEKNPELSADYFYYPKKGIIQLSEKLAQEIKKNKGRILLNKRVSKIFWGKKNGFEYAIVESEGKREKVEADFFVSTMPLPELVNMLSPLPPKVISDTAEKLNFNSLVLLYLIIKKPRVLEGNWIYFPEGEFLFNRISEQKSMSEYCCPNLKTVLVAEFTSTKENSFENLSAKELLEKMMPKLEALGICSKEDVEEVFTKKIKNTYPVYGLDYKSKLSTVLNFLDNIPNMLSIGRGGLFNYNNMDHCIDSGFKAADKISKGKSKQEWVTEREKFYNYKIID